MRIPHLRPKQLIPLGLIFLAVVTLTIIIVNQIQSTSPESSISSNSSESSSNEPNSDSLNSDNSSPNTPDPDNPDSNGSDLNNPDSNNPNPDDPHSPENSNPTDSPNIPNNPNSSSATTPSTSPANTTSNSSTTLPQGNCTSSLGKLTLINPVFTVSTDFIANRKSQLVNINTLYGIVEGNAYNGAPLLDPEAAAHLNDMISAYVAAYPGHTIETRSCFRSVGTSCGRLCYATGTSDHHSGYTCDLLDPAYGTSLDTDHLPYHIEWQWLKQNSYKYGFIDRFPAEWAGGPMSQPVNINAEGSTGLYETWHYRYVGVDAATEIATGKYNNGSYDSLEHYLLMKGYVSSLTTGTCR